MLWAPRVFTDLGKSFTSWRVEAFWLKATAWAWSDAHGWRTTGHLQTRQPCCRNQTLTGLRVSINCSISQNYPYSQLTLDSCSCALHNRANVLREMQRQTLFNSVFPRIMSESKLTTVSPEKCSTRKACLREGVEAERESWWFCCCWPWPPPHLMEVRMFGGNWQWEGLEEGGPEKTKGNMFGALHPPKPLGRKSILMGKNSLGVTELLCSFFSLPGQNSSNPWAMRWNGGGGAGWVMTEEAFIFPKLLIHMVSPWVITDRRHRTDPTLKS